MEILPGSEMMTDFGSHHFIKATTSSHQVLVPQPSDDPNDPLVWFDIDSGSSCLADRAIRNRIGPHYGNPSLSLVH